MITLMLALACGIDEPLMQPNPPPAPAPGFLGMGENEVTVSGTVSSVSGDTRSWVQIGDGQKIIVHLPATGVLIIDGRTSVPGDLQLDMLVKTHGHQQGDLVVVIDATVTTPGATPVAGVAGAPGAQDPAALDPAAPAVVEPGAPVPALGEAPAAGEPAVVAPAAPG